MDGLVSTRAQLRSKTTSQVAKPYFTSFLLNVSFDLTGAYKLAGQLTVYVPLTKPDEKLEGGERENITVYPL